MAETPETGTEVSDTRQSLADLAALTGAARSDRQVFENPYGISISIGALIALGGRYGILPEAKILSVLTPIAIMCCVAAFLFRLWRRGFAAR